MVRFLQCKVSIRALETVSCHWPSRMHTVFLTTRTVPSPKSSIVLRHRQDRLRLTNLLSPFKPTCQPLPAASEGPPARISINPARLVVCVRRLSVSVQILCMYPYSVLKSRLPGHPCLALCHVQCGARGVPSMQPGNLRPQALSQWRPLSPPGFLGCFAPVALPAAAIY